MLSLKGTLWCVCVCVLYIVLLRICKLVCLCMCWFVYLHICWFIVGLYPHNTYLYICVSLSMCIHISATQPPGSCVVLPFARPLLGPYRALTSPRYRRGAQHGDRRGAAGGPAGAPRGDRMGRVARRERRRGDGVTGGGVLFWSPGQFDRVETSRFGIYRGGILGAG